MRRTWISSMIRDDTREGPIVSPLYKIQTDTEQAPSSERWTMWTVNLRQSYFNGNTQQCETIPRIWKDRTTIIIMLAIILLAFLLSTTTTTSGGKETRIIGGTPLTADELQTRYPYTASLQWGGHRCGGTLVASDLVLTAAHCVYIRLVDARLCEC